MVTILDEIMAGCKSRNIKYVKSFYIVKSTHMLRLNLHLSTFLLIHY
jgi:hypothetical protein